MQQYITKLEHQVAEWLRKVPHLPATAQKWIADNIWWITIVGAIMGSIAVIFAVSAFFTIMSYLANPTASYFMYYAVAPYSNWSIVTALVSLVFLAAMVLIMWVAVKPLQDKTKKGWTLLFVLLLISAVSTVLNAVLSLNVFTFISNIIFGAIGLAISAYLLFEIRAQFAHTTKGARTTRVAPTSTKGAK